MTTCRSRSTTPCRWAGVDRVDYIKMDIEGSEIAALEGAHETILKHRPKLGICVYHRPTDLWAIPNLIRRKYPFYSLYLDHHALHDEETVLYARRPMTETEPTEPSRTRRAAGFDPGRGAQDRRRALRLCARRFNPGGAHERRVAGRTLVVVDEPA